MKHFSALKLRRAFLTPSIVAFTCLSLTLVVVPLFRETTVLAVADDFDPQKGQWLYRQTQYNEAEKNRLLKRANALPQNDVRRADLLVTVIKHYGNHLSRSDKQFYAQQALKILESADWQKKKADFPDLFTNDNPHPRIISAKMCIDAQNVDEAAYDLSYLCYDLAQPSVCEVTNAVSELDHPNPAERAKLFLEASFMLACMNKTESPSHDLALKYSCIGSQFEQGEHFNCAVNAYKKALEIDDLCFPDKTIMFCDYFLSGLGETSPILTDCNKLADAYMDAAMYKEAAQIYRRAIETESAIEAKDGRKSQHLTPHRGLKTAIRLAAQSAR